MTQTLQSIPEKLDRNYYAQKSDIEELKKLIVEEIKPQIDQVYVCLAGDGKLIKTGLVQRVECIENQVDPFVQDTAVRIKMIEDYKAKVESWNKAGKIADGIGFIIGGASVLSIPAIYQLLLWIMALVKNIERLPK